MSQAGGDLSVAGHHGDRPWRLGIRDPRGPADKSFAALDLTDGTFSESLTVLGAETVLFLLCLLAIAAGLASRRNGEQAIGHDAH